MLYQLFFSFDTAIEDIICIIGIKIFNYVDLVAAKTILTLYPKLRYA